MVFGFINVLTNLLCAIRSYYITLIVVQKIDVSRLIVVYGFINVLTNLLCAIRSYYITLIVVQKIDVK